MKRNRILNNILDKDRYIILLTVWLIINSNAYIRASKISNIGSIFLGVYAMLILFYDVVTMQREYFDFPGITVSVLMIIAASMSFLGNRFSYPVKNIYSIISVCVNFLFLYTYCREPNSKKTLELSASIIMIVTLVVSIINISMLYRLVSIPVGEAKSIFDYKFMGVDLIRGRFTGLSGNANGLARFSLSGFIVSFIIFIKNEDFTYFKTANLIRAISIVSIFVNTIVIFLSQSRGTILALLVGILSYIFMIVFHKLRTPSQTRKFLLVIKNLLIALVLVVVFADGSSFLVKNMPYKDVEKIGGTQTQKIEGLVDREDRDKDILDDDITNGRVVIIRNGVNATMAKNPLFGLTYGGSFSEIRRYIDTNNVEVPDYIYRTAGSMHNTVVQAFVNYGFLGLFAMIMFLLHLIKVFWKANVNRIENEKELKTMSLFTFIFAIMFVLNMVEYVFYFDFSNHLVNFILMVAAGLFSQKYSRKSI